ncbi:Uma2 family endonuclease [Nocardia huaxiensis]|uniref:Uma2 family endonuclease n=1 Tax=Nocardia huaxiensis TaxID=2755382 RepID=A0A7D6Z6P4_9NOCA|nr:Uma2 family endonuclease [Nocardia huaxiensis]QLY32984.1 Uma2 family endonuclease [Nocardia huaxiensis]UFS93255.1 Uma2 family endonuclease [Nocardia huaxiensis]
MSEAYDWSWMRHPIPVIDLDMYLDMPADLSRAIEVKDGMLVHCESPSPNHIAVTSAIEQGLRRAIRERAPFEPCVRASREVDMLVSEVPFSFRRPDAIVYRCIDDPREKWGRKPTAGDALLVVEVVSPSTVTADCIEKRALYARLGIPHYWIVRMANDDGPVVSIERLRLTSGGAYVTEDTALRSKDPVAAVSVIDPLKAEITWAELDLDVE